MTDAALTEAALASLTPARVRHGALSMAVVLPANQAEVWRCITQPEALAQWSPVVPDRPLVVEGPASSREQPDQEPVDATVGEAREPWSLEHRWGPDQLTWQLAPSGEGTQLNLVHEFSAPDMVAEMAAGWHLCLVVLGRQLAGETTSRCVGADALDHGWPVLRDRYAEMLRDQLT